MKMTLEKFPYLERIFLNNMIFIIFLIVFPLLIIFCNLNSLLLFLFFVFIVIGILSIIINLFTESKFYLFSIKKTTDELNIKYYKFNKIYSVNQSIDKLSLRIFRAGRDQMGFKLLNKENDIFIKQYPIIDMKENKTVEIAEHLIKLGVKTDNKSIELIYNSKGLFTLNK